MGLLLMFALAEKAAAKPKPGKWQRESVVVPLDSANPGGETLSLAVSRWRGRQANKKTAIVSLAGGPGQAATPLAALFARELGDNILRRYDMIVFDQRGTGRGALVCRKAETDLLYRITPDIAAGCASEIGPRRRFFSTQETVADIEALRVRYGYEQLILYGTSYGTKVALDYARSYPTHTARLLLDSLVAADRDSQASSLSATPRIWSLTCRIWNCRTATKDAGGDFVEASRRLAAAPQATVYDGQGQPEQVTLLPEMLQVLSLGGDLFPQARTDIVGLAHSVSRGDYVGLARAQQLMLKDGQDGILSRASLSDGLTVATNCMDAPVLWNETATADERVAALDLFFANIAASDFAGLPPIVARNMSNLGGCLAWPDRPTPAPPATKLNMPTLIVDGIWDSRTPIEGAPAVMATLPRSQLLVADNGHSVILNNSCARRAARRFLLAKAIGRCPGPKKIRGHYALAADPLSLRELKAVSGYEPVVGRALRGVVVTVESGSARSFSLDSMQAGGYRGGWVEAKESNQPNLRQLVFHDFSYIPGMVINGSLVGRWGELRGQLTISGEATGSVAFKELAGDGQGKVTVVGKINGVSVGARLPAFTVSEKQRAAHLRRLLRSTY